MPDPVPGYRALQLLLLTFAGLMNREQARAIDYLLVENRVLREQLGGKRLRLTDDQRRRLAVRGKALGRKLLSRVATIVTPDTILGWHRRLIERKATRARRGLGRPRIRAVIRDLIVSMAMDNPSWGYARIQGELKKLGHDVARSTIAKTLKEHGVPPSPERPTSWRAFLRAHADVIVGADFFTADVWTARGLVTCYVLVFIEHAKRVAHIAGVTASPDGEFMAQVARNLTDPFEGFLRGKRFVVVDRDTKFTAQFDRILEEAGVRVIRTARQAPNMNAFTERWIQSAKRECLDRMVLFGEERLRRVLAEYLEHYNRERPHQGIGNVPITTGRVGARGRVRVRERLGGVLRHYYRAVA